MSNIKPCETIALLMKELIKEVNSNITEQGYTNDNTSFYQGCIGFGTESMIRIYSIAEELGIEREGCFNENCGGGIVIFEKIMDVVIPQ